MATQGDPEFNINDPLGCDLLWEGDLDAAHRLESGITQYVHDIFARITTPRGRLIDDQDYGIDVVDELLSVPLTKDRLAAIPRRLEAEIKKDPRTDTVAVGLQQLGNYAFRIPITGTCGGGQPFRLVVGVADALARILEAS